MVSSSLKALYNYLFSEHKEQYRHFIESSDLINPDGNINECIIAEIAKRESQNLSSAFCNDTMDCLISYIEMYMKQRKWEELACFLFIHFYMIHNKIPYLFVMRIAHDGVSQVYCKYLYCYLNKR